MKKSKTFGETIYLFCGITLILMGVYLIIANKVVIGQYQLTQQGATYGGGYLIFFGFIALLVYYHTLSPFSKIRRFFEGRIPTNKKESNDSELTKK